MSKKLFFLPALLLGAMLMFAPACGDSDPCKDVACGDSGNCFDGACICNEGYEQGVSGVCDTESRVKFYGNYNVSEVCTPGGAGNYASVISAASADVTKINIANFGDTALNVSANVDGSTITVPSQTININAGTATVSGTGSISGTTITLNYAASGSVNFTCVATLTR